MPYIAVIGLQVLCIVHLMRTGRNPLWLNALIFLPVVSALAYLIVEVLPGMGSNRHVRTARAKAIDAIDPERELRAAPMRWRRWGGTARRCRSIGRASR